MHLVIVGFGSMGRHLAMQAAKIGHFANFQKLRVTVMEQQGSMRPDAFLARHPKFGEVCDFAFLPVDMPKDQLDPNAILRVLPPDGAKELVTVAVCWDSSKKDSSDQADFLQALACDDPTNLSLALAVARDPACRRRVLVFQTRKLGFGALFPVEGRGEAIGTQVQAFGMLEDTWSLEALLHEREDAIAKVLHKDYYDNQLAKGRKQGERPALFPWEQLLEQFKDSNRRAADHIRVKLRAAGYRLDDFRRDQPSIQSFDEDQIELLARMEHASWCAEWMLKGYSYGPGERDDVAKTLPYLVPWDKLDKGVQEWDREQVRAIPGALRRAKYGIYPQVQ